MDTSIENSCRFQDAIKVLSNNVSKLGNMVDVLSQTYNPLSDTNSESQEFSDDSEFSDCEPRDCYERLQLCERSHNYGTMSSSEDSSLVGDSPSAESSSSYDILPLSLDEDSESNPDGDMSESEIVDVKKEQATKIMMDIMHRDNYFNSSNLGNNKSSRKNKIDNIFKILPPGVMLSDASLKETVINLPESNGLATLNTLRPVTYQWSANLTDDQGAPIYNAGFIAQEVKSTQDNQSLLYKMADSYTDPDDGKSYLAIESYSFFPMLIKSAQQLSVTANANAAAISTNFTTLESKITTDIDNLDTAYKAADVVINTAITNLTTAVDTRFNAHINQPVLTTSNVVFNQVSSKISKVTDIIGGFPVTINITPNLINAPDALIQTADAKVTNVITVVHPTDITKNMNISATSVTAVDATVEFKDTTTSTLQVNSINAIGNTLDIGTTAGLNTINIGANALSGTKTIAIGKAGDTITFGGDVIQVNATELVVEDKSIVLNKAADNSVIDPDGSGLFVARGVPEDSAFLKVSHISATDWEWAIKVPDSTFLIKTPAPSTIPQACIKDLVPVLSSNSQLVNAVQYNASSSDVRPQEVFLFPSDTFTTVEYDGKVWTTPAEFNNNGIYIGSDEINQGVVLEFSSTDEIKELATPLTYVFTLSGQNRPISWKVFGVSGSNTIEIDSKSGYTWTVGQTTATLTLNANNTIIYDSYKVVILGINSSNEPGLYESKEFSMFTGLNVPTVQYYTDATYRTRTTLTSGDVVHSLFSSQDLSTGINSGLFKITSNSSASDAASTYTNVLKLSNEWKTDAATVTSRDSFIVASGFGSVLPSLLGELKEQGTVNPGIYTQVELPADIYITSNIIRSVAAAGAVSEVKITASRDGTFTDEVVIKDITVIDTSTLRDPDTEDTIFTYDVGGDVVLKDWNLWPNALAEVVMNGSSQATFPLSYMNQYYYANHAATNTVTDVVTVTQAYRYYRIYPISTTPRVFSTQAALSQWSILGKFRNQDVTDELLVDVAPWRAQYDDFATYTYYTDDTHTTPAVDGFGDPVVSLFAGVEIKEGPATGVFKMTNNNSQSGSRYWTNIFTDTFGSWSTTGASITKTSTFVVTDTSTDTTVGVNFQNTINSHGKVVGTSAVSALGNGNRYVQISSPVDFIMEESSFTTGGSEPTNAVRITASVSGDFTDEVLITNINLVEESNKYRDPDAEVAIFTFDINGDIEFKPIADWPDNQASTNDFKINTDGSGNKTVTLGYLNNYYYKVFSVSGTVSAKWVNDTAYSHYRIYPTEGNQRNTMTAASINHWGIKGRYVDGTAFNTVQLSFKDSDGSIEVNGADINSTVYDAGTPGFTVNSAIADTLDVVKTDAITVRDGALTLPSYTIASQNAIIPTSLNLLTQGDSLAFAFWVLKGEGNGLNTFGSVFTARDGVTNVIETKISSNDTFSKLDIIVGATTVSNVTFPTIVEKQWTHVAVALTPERAIVWIDNVKYEDASFAWTPQTDIKEIDLLHNDQTNVFINSSISDLVFTDYLTDIQVAALYSTRESVSLVQTFRTLGFTSIQFESINIYEPYKMFDDNDNTCYAGIEGNYTAGVYTGPNSFEGIDGDWVSINISQAKMLCKYSIRVRDKTIAPKNFTIFGSMDNITWDVVDERKDTVWNTNIEMFEIGMENMTTEYLYFTIVVSELLDGPHLTMCHLEFYGTDERMEDVLTTASMVDASISTNYKLSRKDLFREVGILNQTITTESKNLNSSMIARDNIIQGIINANIDQPVLTTSDVVFNSVTVAGNINVTGGTSFDTIIVGTDALIIDDQKNVTIGGPALEVSAPTVLTSSLMVDLDSTLKGNVSVGTALSNKVLSVQGGINVQGTANSIINAPLIVKGTALIVDALDNTTIGHDLTVNESALIQSTLSVVGGVTMGAHATVGTAFTVNTDALSVDISRNTSMSGDLTIGGDLDAGNMIIADSANNTVVIKKDVRLGRDLNLPANAITNPDDPVALGVTGLITAEAGLTINGPGQLQSNVNSTFTAPVQVNNDVGITGTLTVDTKVATQDLDVLGNVVVTGNTTANGPSVFSDTVAMNGTNTALNLTVANDLNADSKLQVGGTGFVVDVTAETISTTYATTINDALTSNSLAVVGATTTDTLTVAGATSLSTLGITGLATAGSLTVAGVTDTDSLTVTGATSTNTLGVTGAATADSLTVAGVTSTNTLGVTGATTTDTLTVAGATSTNTLGITGLATAGSLTVAGVTDTNSLTVTGATSTNTLGVTGAATVDSLTVAGATSTNTLGVTGAATADSITIAGATSTNTLGVTGAASAGNLTVSGSTLSGTLTVAGVTSTATLGVTGAATAGSMAVSGLTSSTNITATGITSTATLTVTGGATANNLTVAGVTSTNTLGVTGIATAGSLNVTGASTLATLGVTGLATADSLTVAAATSLSTLAVSGTSNFTGLMTGVNSTFTEVTAPTIVTTTIDTSPAGTLNIGCNADTSIINIGTNSATANQINIGTAGDTIILGTNSVVRVKATELNVTDPTLTLNVSDSAPYPDATGSGVFIAQNTDLQAASLSLQNNGGWRWQAKIPDEAILFQFPSVTEVKYTSAEGARVEKIVTATILSEDLTALETKLTNDLGNSNSTLESKLDALEDTVIANATTSAADDAALNTALTNKINTDISTVNTSITNLTTASQAADADLATDIANLTTASQAADTNLATSITNLTTASQAAAADLATDIANLTTASELADTNLTNALASTDSTLLALSNLTTTKFTDTQDAFIVIRQVITNLLSFYQRNINRSTLITRLGRRRTELENEYNNL